MEKTYESKSFHRNLDMEAYAIMGMQIQVRFHRWQEILSAGEPPVSRPLKHLFWHYTRAIAFADLGKVQESLNEKTLFLKEREVLGSQVNAVTATILKLSASQLEARLEESQGNVSKAVEVYRQAIQEQDAFGYNEFVDWSCSLREALGGLYLRNRKYVEAEEVFRKDLEKHPKNGRSLYGLRESLTGQSKTYDRYWVDKEFQQAWMYSDTNLRDHIEITFTVLE